MNMKKSFDFKGITNFDRHIEVSIPNYSGLAEIFSAIACENVHPNGLFLDLGCSTGKFISSLPKIDGAEYCGVDTVDIRAHGGFKFIEGDALDYVKGIETADVVCAMFLLQFMGRHKRAEMINELVRLNSNGAVILLSEKIYLDNSHLNLTLHREHQRKKRDSFSSDEILEKDYSLVGSMYCVSESIINCELDKFKNCTTVWQSYNFKGWALT